MQNTLYTESVNGGRAEKPGFKYRKTRLERLLFSITMASCLASLFDSVVILTEDDIQGGFTWGENSLIIEERRIEVLAVEEIPLKVSLKLHHRSLRKADLPPYKYCVHWTLISFWVNSTWCLTSKAWSNLFHNFCACTEMLMRLVMQISVILGVSCVSYYHWTLPCNYRILHITQHGTHTTFDLLCQTDLKELLLQKLKSSWPC